jgi:hypothetical protein
MIDRYYADYAWEQTAQLLGIDSPSGFRRGAASGIRFAGAASQIRFARAAILLRCPASSSPTARLRHLPPAQLALPATGGARIAPL